MKKLWDTKAFLADDKSGQKNKSIEWFSSYFLTILLAAFLLIVVCILVFILWTSNGGSNQEQAEQAFYDPSKSSSLVSSSTEAPSQTEERETTESSTASSTSPSATGETLTVMSGEGAGQIAARAGISLERLYELNPDKMVGPGGTWWANPGDVVIVN
ncbi:SAG1386/EF1546 family surface-associated protein [Streptococcus sp. E29BA]|uniref:SAG1386/EF1546 family surface-associated protein n=1 Tax=Streptococcus sp. E29BA TaxID=3278716 RepID=UPI00359D632D